MTATWRDHRRDLRGDQFRSATSHQFTGWSAWRLLEARAAHTGDAPFMTWQPFDAAAITWGYADLLRDASSVASGLARRGVSRGDRVLVHLENGPEFVIAWFACAAVGAVAVTTNTRSAGDEIAYYASDSGAIAAITQPRLADVVSTHARGLSWQETLAHDSGEGEFTDPRRLAAASFGSLYDDPDALQPATADPWAPMSVQYTSGTTSRPKGVVWTHANALWASRVNAVHEDLHPDDCHLTYAPLFHTNALAYSVLPNLWVGSRFVLMPKWSTSRFWDVSLRHGCTWLSLVGPAPSVVARTAAFPEGHRYRLFGAGVCDPAFARRVGVKTIGWWGMTETVSHPILGDPYLPNRPYSMGRPAPEYGVAVVRDDGVTPVEVDEPGELLVAGTRGLSLFAGYLGKPEATEESFDEFGWFRTGDIVTPHADGHISFTDRAKEMLRVGGENVAASEIERVVASVRGVREVAVVGCPDKRLDEVPVAFVIAPDAAEGLADIVIGRCAEMLADFKVPRAVHVVRELPRSTNLKINKQALRKSAWTDEELEAAQHQWIEEARRDPAADAD